MAVMRVLGGRYRLIEQLGSGGMSVVWRAYDEVLGRDVAVKVLPPGGPADDGSRGRILAEAQQAARLAHPYITSVHDYGESPIDDDGEPVPFVVMELVSGPTLADRLDAGPVPVVESLRICAQVAAALAAAHARGVVHRDIKPANIILSPSGAKVLDFGIAAAAGEASVDVEVWGTPAYLAPERLEGGIVVPASDVYALGLLLYRLLAGELPWRAGTVTQMIDAHRYVEPAPLPHLPGVHGTVREICARCLDKDPDERPAAGDVARMLAAATGRHGRAVATAVGQSGPFAPTDTYAETGAAPSVKYRNTRSATPVVVVPPDAVGVLAEEYRATLADEAPDDPVGAAGSVGEPGSADSAGVAGSVGGVAGSADPAVPRRPGTGASVAAETVAPGPVPERGAAVPAIRVPSGRPQPRSRRRSTITGVAVLVTVGLLAWYLAAGDTPDRTGPTAGTSAPPPATASQNAADPARPGGSPAPSGTAAAPGSPIQPGAVGGLPDQAGGTGGDGPDGATAPPGGEPEPGGGTTPGPGNGGVGPTNGRGPVERTFDTAGGSVTARCAGVSATIVGWSPLPGFVASAIQRGPGPQASVTFSSATSSVHVTVRCVDGVPVD